MPTILPTLDPPPASTTAAARKQAEIVVAVQCISLGRDPTGEEIVAIASVYDHVAFILRRWAYERGVGGGATAVLPPASPTIEPAVAPPPPSTLPAPPATPVELAPAPPPPPVEDPPPAPSTKRPWSEKPAVEPPDMIGAFVRSGIEAKAKGDRDAYNEVKGEWRKQVRGLFPGEEKRDRRVAEVERFRIMVLAGVRAKGAQAPSSEPKGKAHAVAPQMPKRGGRKPGRPRGPASAPPDVSAAPLPTAKPARASRPLPPPPIGVPVGSMLKEKPAVPTPAVLLPNGSLNPHWLPTKPPGRR